MFERMNDEQIIRYGCKMFLSKIFTDNDYLESVYNLIIDDVISDVTECADKNFNISDISLAVQRSLLSALKIEF